MKSICAWILGGLLLAFAAGAYQDEPSKAPPPEKSAPKAEPKKESNRDVMTVQLKLKLEGETSIALPSNVELKASEPDCGKLDRSASLDGTGLATASKIPVCKVAVWVFISGMDSKVVTIDLGKYKDKEPPIQILLDKQGEISVQN